MERSSLYCPGSCHGAGRCLLREETAIISQTQTRALRVTTRTGLTRYACGSNGGLDVMGVCGHFKIGIKTCTKRWNPYLASLIGPSFELLRTSRLPTTWPSHCVADTTPHVCRRCSCPNSLLFSLYVYMPTGTSYKGLKEIMNKYILEELQ